MGEFIGAFLGAFVGTWVFWSFTINRLHKEDLEDAEEGW